MRFYNALYDTVAAAEASGNPTRTWVLKTDEDGFCYLDTTWLVSGDAFYYADNGDITLPIGTVLMHETKAPEGYFINDEVYLVKITESGADQAIIGTYNAPITPEQVLTGNIQITKTTRTGLDKHVVPEDGAVFEIYLKSAGSYANAAETDRALLTTDANGVAIATDLPYGTYTVHQVSGWEGSALCDDFDVTIDTNGKTYSYDIENERFYSKVQLVKLDSRTGLPIPEANVGFQIKYPNGSLVSYNGTDTWYTDSTGTLTLPMELEYGKVYQAIELNAPDGYVLSSTPINFDVTADAATTLAGEPVILVDVNNTPTSVEVSKTDAAGNGVSGAKLQVLTNAGTVVDEWTTNGTAHMIYALSIGGQYILREATAPAGYVLAKDVAFTVADTTDIQPVSMTNKQVLIEKLDGDGNSVQGATLQILDSAGTVVDEWVSNGNPHAANNLVIGESYTLRESAAPAGYVKAEDISFTVAETPENQTFSMTNKQVLIQKLDVAGSFIVGAKLQVLDSAGNMVDEWTTGNTAYGPSNLVIGETYTLHETEAPAGYVKAKDVVFTIEKTSDTQTVSMVDKQVVIEKLDTDGNFVTGAKLQILNSAGTVVDEWTTDGTAHTAKNLAVGERYTLRETEAPAGFVKAKDVVFTVTATTETQKVSMVDKKVVVEKVDADGNGVSGAKLQILDAAENVVDEWTTDGTPHVAKGLVVGESYTLREVSTPVGYVQASRMTFLVTADNATQTVSMTDKQVFISKVTADGSALSSATMQILDSKGFVVDTWVTGKDPHAAKSLVAGLTYTLHEAEAPEGYVRAADIEFTVADDGKNQSISMVDKQVFVKKVDASGNFVIGAKLQILDSAGNVVDEWTSAASAHATNNLLIGETYTLHEAETPAGFVTAKDISFSVSSSNDAQTVIMTDMCVLIEKVDADNKALSGAKMQILDSTGAVVDEWTTDGSVYAATGLKAGETYTLHEAEAPAGYVRASDIHFTVEDDGKNQSYTVVDKQVFVEKRDTDGNFVIGAKLQVLDSEGKVVDEWDSSNSAHAISNLLIGQDYTLHEVSAPDGYVLANDIAFSVTVKAETQTVSMTDKRILIAKIDGNNAPLSGATLQILDSAGNVVDEWTSAASAHATNNLLIGETYTLHEAETPAGYVRAADIQFKVEDDGKNQSYTMIDKQVMVEKLDADRNFVCGAKLQVLDSAGTVVDEWISDGKTHAINNLLIGESYTLHEAETPEGYVTAKNISFTVALTPETQTVTMTDMQVFVEKVDVNNAGLSGAKMQILDSNDKVVHEWTTDGTVHAVSGLIAGERYTLHEAEAPAGYVRASDIHFVVEDDGKNQSYTVTDKQVIVEKVAANGNFVHGAKLHILDSEGKVVDEWTTDGKPHAVSNLLIGKEYTLHEASTPDGYVQANDITFTVSVKSASQTVSMTDMRVFVRKVVADGKALSGATMQILNAKGVVVDEWITDGTVYSVSGLKAGETYTLHEAKAPTGYVTAKDIVFTVEDDGKDQSLGVVDKQVYVEKLDADGNSVLNAKLQILDAAGKVVDEWISDGTPHVVSNLLIGESYALHEAETPDGYVTAKDIPFVVALSMDTQTISMVDKRILVEKVDATNAPLSGATLQILDSNGDLVDEWVTDGTTYAVKGLRVGETYTLHEVKAPAGYVCAADISFTIEDDGKNQSYTMIDKQVMVEKLDADGNFVQGAKLQILDAAGKVVDEWTSDGTPHAVSNLLIGESYTLHEAETPEGYVTAKDISFTVALTPDTQTVTMTDMQVFVEKVDVNNAGLSGAKMQILDANDKVVHEWITDGNPHAIIGLKAGERYIIHEAAAPAGYVRAADMHFTVEDNGKNKSYTVTDKQVFVEKLDADGNFVTGAKLQVLDADGKVVDEWTTDDKAHAVSNLLIGKDYTLREVGTPDGYVKANDVPFTVAVKSETQTVSMTDKKLIVEKVDPYGNAVKGATLQVLDDAGTVIDEWVSDGTAYAVTGLTAGESYILHEEAAPDGWLVSYDLPFTVTDDEKDQTVSFENEEIPVLKTKATVDDRHEAFAKADITLTDVVTYEKLVPGREYVVKGTLMDQETGESLKNEDGEPITSSVTFTPTESSGTVDVTFVYTPVAGSTVVVFQQIYKNDRLLNVHEDISDADQTVHFPAIDTTATIDEKKEVYRSSTIELLDVVEYTNLTVGKEYTVKGVLMNKKTGEPLKAWNSDELITATATFTPEKPDGKVDVVFTFSGYVISTTTDVVVFEEIYDGDYLVAEHEDIEDADQTVTIKVYHYVYVPPVEPVDSGDIGFTSFIFSALTAVLGMVLLIRKRRKSV